MYSKAFPFTFNLSFFLAVLGLLGIFAYGGIGFNALIKSNERVSHTLIVLGKLDEILADIVDAESGVRGYIITGDETFLDPYDAALDPQKGVHALLAELRQFTADNPSQQARLDRLEELVNNKMAILSRNVEIRRREGFEAAQEWVAIRDGKREMDAIRSIIEEMRAEEFALLQMRSESASKNLRNVLGISAVGVPFTLALMAASYFLLLRQIRDRRKAEEDLRKLNAELDQRVTERTAALAESERNFRDLADSAPIGIARTTLEGEIQYANPTLAHMMGFDSPAELIRAGTIARYRDPADQQAFLEKLQRDGKVESYEVVLLNKYGKPLNALLSAQINGDKIIGTFLDITQRKQAERDLVASQKRFEALIEHAPDGIALLGLDGKLRQITPSAQQILGYSAEEAIGQDPASLTHPDDLPDLLNLLNDIMQKPGEFRRTQYRFRHRDGSWRWLESTISNLLSEPGIEALVFNYRDITERKRLEIEMQDQLLQLEAQQKQLQRFNEQLTVIGVLGATLAESLELPQIFERLAAAAQQLLPDTAGLVISQYSSERQQFIAAYISENGQVMDVSNLPPLPLAPPGKGVQSDVVHTRRPIIINNLRERLKTSVSVQVGDERETQSALHVPMLMQGEVIGVLQVQSYIPNRYSENDAQLLMLLGNTAAVAIQNARLYQQAIQEIAERKRAEEALMENEKIFRIIANNSPDIIFSQTIDLIYNRIINPAPPLTPEHVVGKTDFDLLPLKEAQRLTELKRGVIETGESIHQELQLSPGGIPRWYDVVYNPAYDEDGRIVGLVSYSRDITDRKQAEEDRLAREVADRANQAKSEFLSRMSHEFRTPLNAILGFAQLLKMDELTPAQERGVEQIYKSGRHLLDLVNEVLDIARIEAGRMTISPEPVRVKDAVNEVLDLIRPMAEAKRLSLTFKIPSSTDVFVEADRQRFKQVLLNLLSNAVKYNREGGVIEVIASLTIGGYLRLHVRDTGEGIPPEKMERLFVPFDRLDTEATEGTGLGLALSKSLVEAMGGRIGAESTVGEGSTFWIELKLVTDRLKEVIMAEVDEHLTENMRQGRGVVLYVEDNLANVNLIEAILERIPEVKLITAMQGRLALDLAKEQQPDLILLDLHLPDMHGSEILRRLKAEPATQSIPVVVISADAMPSHMNDLLALGAKGYLTKPIDVKEFLKVIEEAVDKPKDF